MNVTVDMAYKSLNKFHEELCGDKVEMLKTDDSYIMILADGMGSGVKANILSTLTSKILGTMFLNGATLDECVETIVETLPICQVRHVAYSTFSILQVFHNGEAYLVEFDNPSCIFLREGEIVPIPHNERVIQNKTINEYRFTVKKNDTFILMSDGMLHAGVGTVLNFGWDWKEIAAYTKREAAVPMSAARLANVVVKASDDLYDHRPGDDTTVACLRIIDRKPVYLMSGPAKDKADDSKMMADFMNCEESVKRIVCGGTSSLIVAKYLDRPLDVSIDYLDPDIPPVAYIKGIDLVTEGVLTLSRALSLMQEFEDSENLSTDFFAKIDNKDGGAMVAKMIIEECTELHLFIGTAVNAAYQNPGLPVNLNIRSQLAQQLKETVEKMGKPVMITYY